MGDDIELLGTVVGGPDAAGAVIELAQVMAAHTCWRTDTGWACQCGAAGTVMGDVTDEAAIRWASIHKAIALTQALGDRLLPAAATIEHQWRIVGDGPGGPTIGARIYTDRAQALASLAEDPPPDWTGWLAHRINAETPWKDDR